MVDRRGREGGINARPCASYTVKTLAVTRNFDFGLVWFATGN